MFEDVKFFSDLFLLLIMYMYILNIRPYTHR